MKHTQGPWEINRGIVYPVNGERNEDGYRYAVATLGKEYKPAAGMIACHNFEEHLANGKLISAAPDMFEALQKALEVLDTMSTEDFARGKDAPVRNAIRAALARAEGR